MFSKKTVAFYTLGCKLNFSETSTICRQLVNAGYTKTKFKNGADIFVINTCSVTENANKECKRIIRKAKYLSPKSFIIVTGCFAQLKPKEISEINNVDLVVGVSKKFNIPELLKKVQEKKEEKIIYGCSTANLDYYTSYSLNDRTRSFLKIQDGCNYPCTYCTIPIARGKSRSDTVNNILKNAKNIANEGIKEIVITGVNIGEFEDPLNNKKLIDLMVELENLENIDRYRISSIEPNLVTKEIINFVQKSKKFMPHFHIPLQSGSDKILSKMKRKYNSTLYRHKINDIYNKIPNVSIGADVIVGFPQETDEDFKETLSLIKALPLSYLHVFPYSERENTLAMYLNNKIPKYKRKERSKKLRLLSDKLKRNFYYRNLETQHRTLFEKENKEGYLFGFTDNYIKIKIPFNNIYCETEQTVELINLDEKGNINAKIIK